MGRMIVFGGVHGCYEELQELFDKLAVTSGDRLISVGDMICKGPASAKVLDLAKSLDNLTCVVGNHELRFLICWRGKRIPNIKPYDKATVEQMGERYEEFMRYIDSWPFFLDLKELLVIHGGLRPGIPLREQKKTDLTKLRRVEPQDKPWYEFYNDSKPVVFGHWVRREVLKTKNVIGLDTGCVYGGKLSAYVFPDDRIIQIPAKKTYVERKDRWE